MEKVYLINGFLDAGKTTFIKELFEKPYFQGAGKTLLIVCEDGEESYTDWLQGKTDVALEWVEEEADFTEENLTKLEAKHRPERIVIEFNGMWMRRNVAFPWYWNDIMEITLFDTATFSLYAANMKTMVAEQVRNAYLVILRNCAGQMEQLAGYRRSLKAIHEQANVVYEDEDGNLQAAFAEDLPYDLKSRVLSLDDAGFVAFYLDSMENLSRYVGKTVCFTAMLLKLQGQDPRYFIAGRVVMACCAEDMTLFGVLCEAVQAGQFADREWVMVEAVVERQYFEQNDRELPKCRVTAIKRCAAPAEPVISTL